MKSSRELRHLHRFWRKATLAFVITGLIYCVFSAATGNYSLPAQFAFVITVTLCSERRDHWLHERRAYLSNRKRFRSFE